jgi:membrane protease YdiL (CAAX protease family)
VSVVASLQAGHVPLQLKSQGRYSNRGWEQVLVISVLGVLYGVLAAWRKKLSVNVMTHAFMNVMVAHVRGVDVDRSNRPR